MYDLKIYLKSGSVVEARAENFTIKKDGLGDFGEFTWKNKNCDRKLCFLRLEDVSAIVATEYKEISI